MGCPPHDKLARLACLQIRSMVIEAWAMWRVGVCRGRGWLCADSLTRGERPAGHPQPAPRPHIPSVRLGSHPKIHPFQNPS